MMKQVEKLILLDFDGTVLDSTNAWSNVYQSYCKEYKIAMSEQICISHSNMPFTEWIKVIIAKHKLTQDAKTLILIFNEIAKGVYNKILPKSGFAEFIQYCQTSKSKTIIVSREEPDLIKYYLKHYQILGISAVFQDNFKNRTRITFYGEVAKIFDLKIQNLALIDDSLSHCTPAKQAGAFIAGMNDNHSVERQYQMRLICDLYVNDFKPLINLWTY